VPSNINGLLPAGGSPPFILRLHLDPPSAFLSVLTDRRAVTGFEKILTGGELS